jgi:hypothetical protein
MLELITGYIMYCLISKLLSSPALLKHVKIKVYVKRTLERNCNEELHNVYEILLI